MTEFEKEQLRLLRRIADQQFPERAIQRFVFRFSGWLALALVGFVLLCVSANWLDRHTHPRPVRWVGPQSVHRKFIHVPQERSL